MITADDSNEQMKQLTADKLAEVRDCWGLGVPLRVLAAKHGFTEKELRVQLVEPAWQPEPSQEGGGR